MNRTIRNETRELLLKLLCVDLNRLSEQTRAEVRHVGGIENNDDDGDEMIEQPNHIIQARNTSSRTHNQIGPENRI